MDAVEALFPLGGKMVGLGAADRDHRPQPVDGRHERRAEFLEPDVLQRAAGEAVWRVPTIAVHLAADAERAADAGLLRDCRRLYRGRGLHHVSEPMAADPLAALADRAVSGRMAV